MSLQLYLEDLSVGQRFTSNFHLIDQQQIITFASQFDPQPFHLDEEAAKQTIFRGLAASGWHTASITMKLLLSTFTLAGGLLGLSGEITWSRPVRPGDKLHVESEIMDIQNPTHPKNRGIVTAKVSTINQNNEIVQTLTAKLSVLSKEIH